MVELPSYKNIDCGLTCHKKTQNEFLQETMYTVRMDIQSIRNRKICSILLHIFSLSHLLVRLQRTLNKISLFVGNSPTENSVIYKYGRIKSKADDLDSSKDSQNVI